MDASEPETSIIPAWTTVDVFDGVTYTLVLPATTFNTLSSSSNLIESSTFTTNVLVGSIATSSASNLDPAPSTSLSFESEYTDPPVAPRSVSGSPRLFIIVPALLLIIIPLLAGVFIYWLRRHKRKAYDRTAPYDPFRSLSAAVSPVLTSMKQVRSKNRNVRARAEFLRKNGHDGRPIIIPISSDLVASEQVCDLSHRPDHLNLYPESRLERRRSNRNLSIMYEDIEKQLIAMDKCTAGNIKEFESPISNVGQNLGGSTHVAGRTHITPFPSRVSIPKGELGCNSQSIQARPSSSIYTKSRSTSSTSRDLDKSSQRCIHLPRFDQFHQCNEPRLSRSMPHFQLPHSIKQSPLPTPAHQADHVLSQSSSFGDLIAVFDEMSNTSKLYSGIGSTSKALSSSRSKQTSPQLRHKHACDNIEPTILPRTTFSPPRFHPLPTCREGINDSHRMQSLAKDNESQAWWDKPGQNLDEPQIRKLFRARVTEEEHERGWLSQQDTAGEDTNKNQDGNLNDDQNEENGRRTESIRVYFANENET